VMNFSGGGCREKSFEKGTMGADMVVCVCVVVVDMLKLNSKSCTGLLAHLAMVSIIYMVLPCVIRLSAYPRFR